MEDYEKAEDFLDDESFRKWILEGDDRAGWSAWLRDNPEREPAVREARHWLLAMGVPSGEAPDTGEALRATWQKIREGENTLRPRRFLTPVRIAASVAIVALVAVVFYMVRPSAPSGTPRAVAPGETIVQAMDKPRLVALPDGSSVLLQPNSSLTYAPAFASRQVRLKGEAFFEIRKDAAHPFLVFANETVTRVVGTSFRVIAWEHRPDVEVVVHTGKVKVYSRKSFEEKGDAGIALSPNEAVRVSTGQFEKLTRWPEPTSAAVAKVEEASFEFTDTPVSRIFQTLEQAYPIRITYPESVLKDCYLSTSLTDEPLPEKLKIVCESLGNNTRFEIKGDQITIYSTGCN